MLRFEQPCAAPALSRLRARVSSLPGGGTTDSTPEGALLKLASELLTSLEAEPGELEKTIAADLIRLVRRLEHDRYELMLFGNYSTGKSSLIKTRFQSVSLPVHADEATALLIKIEAIDGDDTAPRASLVFDVDAPLTETARTQLPKNIVAAREASAASMDITMDELNEWARVKETNAALAQIVDHVLVQVTSHARSSTEASYRITDSPGINASAVRRGVAMKHLDACDVPILVVQGVCIVLQQSHIILTLHFSLHRFGLPFDQRP